MSNCGHAALDWRAAKRAGLAVHRGRGKARTKARTPHDKRAVSGHRSQARHDETRVERCIRHAIEWAYTNGNPDMLKALFGNIAAYDKGKATNAAFIARLPMKLQ